MNLINSLILLAFFSSCSPTSAKKSAAVHTESPSEGASTEAGATNNEEDPTGAGTAAKKPSSKREAPNFQIGDTDGINQLAKKKLILKPAEDKDKVFLIQLIHAYRPVWLNLTKKLEETSGFWSFMAGVNAAADSTFLESFSKEAFAHPEVRTEGMSVHQPIASMGGSDDMAASAERQDDFKVIGHTVSNSLNFPTLGTAVLSLYAIPPSDPLALSISSPSDYTKVYSRLGPLTEDLMDACRRVYEKQSKGHFPEAADTLKCDMVTAGGTKIFTYLNVQMQGNTMTGVGDLEEFFKRQTLVIWKPVPPPGFQCLGMVVTNTPDKPATTADAAGIAAQYQSTLVKDQSGNYQETAKWDYPVYCVQSKYVVEGKIIPMVTNGEVDFYRVGAKNADGVANTNLFWAFPSSATEAERQASKVYVLNKKYVRLLPELKFSAPSK